MTELQIHITNKLMDLGVLPDINNIHVINEIIELVKNNKNETNKIN